MTATLERPVADSRHASGTTPEGPSRPDYAHWAVSAAAGAGILAASTSLNGVIEPWTWFGPVFNTVLPVMIAMSLARTLRLPGLVILLAGLLTLGGCLTSRFVPDQSILGVIPGPGTGVQLQILLNHAEDTVTSQAAPVLPGAGIFLVTCAAIGLIAIAVDTLATTLRMPAVSGIGLLALMVVPAVVKPLGVGMAPFLLTVAAYLLLLGCAQWREGLLAASAETGSTGYLGRGLAVGAAAVAVTVLLPLAIPGFNSGAFPQGARLNVWGSSSGLNPAVTLGNDLRNPAGFGRVTYATNSPEPVYLRAVTLEDFAGQRWEPDQRRDEREPGLQGMGSESVRSAGEFGATAYTRINTDSYTSPWLLAPYAPVSVASLNGRWTWDPKNLSILSYDGGTSVRQEYEVISTLPDLTEERLSAIRPAPKGAVAPVFTDLPEDTPDIVLETTEEVTGRLRNPYDQAIAIQNFLRSRTFTYSVDAPVEGGYDGSSMGVMARFLETRAGYCVHYAGTMAVMARAAGIPSRVAVGYTPGTTTGDLEAGPDGMELREFAVDSRNAHAWPELYFNGVGWVRFEPTPSRGVVPDYAQTITSPFNVRVDDYDNLNPGAADVPQGTAADPEETSAGAADPAAAQSRAAAAGTAAAAGLLLALLPLLIRSARTAARRRRVLAGDGPGAASAAWAQTTEIAGDYGHPALPTDSPRAFSQRLRTGAGLHGPAADSLERLQRAFEREEYAGPAAAPPAGADVALLSAPAASWDDVTGVTAALREQSSLPSRLRARFLPRSLLRPTR
ncbi:transglutaminase domain-containing protein [Arthrobacter frigidicola]|nr:transglutaminase domain-containing protein [Arthrobacter frigidicola]